MRVATLLRKPSASTMTALALVALVAVLAGLDTADTDRYQLEEKSQPHYVSINAQTGSVNETTAAGQTAHSTTVTGTPTACIIGAGNNDQDGDGNKPFAIASSCLLTVNDAGDLDYEGSGFATTYTLRLHVNDASSSDWAFVTINVNDVDEFNMGATTDTDSTANSVAENAGDNTAVGITASASDADGSATTAYSMTINTCLLYTSPSPRDRG